MRSTAGNDRRSPSISKPGEYEFYCPIDGHREQGMEGTIVVGGQARGVQPRARDLGIEIGRLPTGPHNAITDVPGTGSGTRR